MAPARIAAKPPATMVPVLLASIFCTVVPSCRFYWVSTATQVPEVRDDPERLQKPEPPPPVLSVCTYLMKCPAITPGSLFGIGSSPLPWQGLAKPFPCAVQPV